MTPQLNVLFFSIMRFEIVPAKMFLLTTLECLDSFDFSGTIYITLDIHPIVSPINLISFKFLSSFEYIWGHASNCDGATRPGYKEWYTFDGVGDSFSDEGTDT